ncbi:MAG: TniB family NTP-binding protein [Roseateles sp.]|jgi:hypothetical protein|nr:TniB family NTP-binding protein [Burkholderiaceae bacterium]
MTLTFHDAVQQLQQACLMFPAFEAAHQRMEANLLLYRRTGVAQNLLVLGESGTGKTTLARWFCRRYPKQQLLERDVLPVLYVSVPAAATIAGTVEAILLQLGDLEPERGTISSKTARAVRIAKACAVEMLLFDEAQHLHDRGRTHSQYFVGDWLKAFIDALALPVVLLGLPRTKALLQVNEQLRRRFAHQMSLAVTSGSPEARCADSQALFVSLAGALPLPLDPRPHGWADLGERLHWATQGRVAYVKQLLVHAYASATERGGDCLCVDDLARAFTESIWQAGVGALNPFDARFEWRPLDRAGEPFQTGNPGASSSRRRA